MEKMKLARALCKTAFASRPIGQRMRNMIAKYDALNDELFTKIPNLRVTQKEAEHVAQVTQRFKESVEKIAGEFLHFKDHEEPDLLASNMFRNYVTPSLAAATVAGLFGVVYYKRKLEKKTLEKYLSVS